MKPPDAIVTEKVVSDLKERRLLTNEDLPTVAAKLLTGKAKAADWRVWAENALAVTERGNDA